MTRKIVWSAAFILILAVPGFPQQYDPSEAKIRVIQLTDTIYKIQCISGTYVNTLASVGEDGILLVDTGYPQTADLLRDEVKRLGDGRVRMVVNTHEHNDHTSGNAKFAGEAVIISHERVRRAYAGEYFALEAIPRAGTPEVVFTDDLTIHFNGEEIRLRHYPGGHTLGDAVVHFTGSKISFVGDMVFAGSFPGADIARGGDLEHCLANVRRIIDDHPSDTTFVSGHGPDYSAAELEEYLEVGRTTQRLIADEVRAGKSVDEILSSGLLDPWTAWSTGVVSNRDWVTCVRQQYLKENGLLNRSVNEPLTEAIVRGGSDAAVRLYARLRNEEPGRYDFSEEQLNTLGYQLLNRNMIQAAIAILKLNVDAYPESGNVYDSLAEAYLAAGNRERAIEYYRKSLEKDPGNNNARSVLRRLSEDPDGN